MDEDVVCVEEWVGGGVGDVDWGGERMVSKGVESGMVRRVEMGILV